MVRWRVLSLPESSWEKEYIQSVSVGDPRPMQFLVFLETRCIQREALTINPLIYTVLCKKVFKGLGNKNLFLLPAFFAPIDPDESASHPYINQVLILAFVVRSASVRFHAHSEHIRSRAVVTLMPMISACKSPRCRVRTSTEGTMEFTPAFVAVFWVL